MPVWVWVAIGVGAAIVLAAAWAGMRGARSRGLRRRFGPEYERTVAEHGDRRAAESELHERQQAREELEIRPLSEPARERYREAWSRVQASFVDNPSGAVADADRLVAEAMRERGYPVDDFESRAALVSVDHPRVVEHYREGHDIFRSFERGEAATEELRQAMHHYRALFDELLEAPHDGRVADGLATTRTTRGG